MEEQELTLKDKLDFMRELAKVTDLIKEAKPVLRELTEIMDGQATGKDTGSWLKVLIKISDMDEDTLISCLMIAVATISQVRVTIKDTALEKELREALELPAPKVPEVEQPLADEA